MNSSLQKHADGEKERPHEMVRMLGEPQMQSTAKKVRPHPPCEDAVSSVPHNHRMQMLQKHAVAQKYRLA